MKFNHIVFDSSALISENFPDLSAAFRQLVEIAKILKMNLYVPEIVMKELEQKFFDNTEDSFNTIRKSHRKLKKFVQEKVLISLPETTDIKLEYVKEIENLKTINNLIIIPIPSLKAKELIERAVQRIPPFERNDKGFRDAMIIESIMEYGITNKIDNFILVAFDSIFDSKEIVTIAKDKGINLTVEKTIDNLNKKIYEFLTKVQKETIKEKERRAIEFLNTKRNEIDQYLVTNFELAKHDISDFLISPVALLSAKLIKVTSAVREEKDDKKIAISFNADVNVNVSVRSLGLGKSGDEKRTYKIGEYIELDSPLMIDSIMNADTLFMQPTVNKNFTVKTKGEVEVEKIDNEYKNFRIIYIRPEPKLSGLLSSYLQNAE